MHNLAQALYDTANRLDGGARYSWTHMGACNCGHLAQTLTDKSAAELHALALERAGDWREQLAHCPTTGLPIDDVIEILLEAGLSRQQLADLERLADKTVLKRIGVPHLDHRRRSHVVQYMRAWAGMLEEQAVATDALPGLLRARAVTTID